MQVLREHIPPHYFPVEQGHSLPHKVWRDLFRKVFHGKWGTIFGRQIYSGAVLHGGLMIRSSCQGQGSSDWGSKWGLPWGSLCGASGKRKICMVPCNICHIYGIWRNRGGRRFEVIIWRAGRGVAMQATRRGFNFNGEGGVGFSLYVILLCWNFVTGYCKKFYRIYILSLYFLLFYLFCIYWKLARPKVQVRVS